MESLSDLLSDGLFSLELFSSGFVSLLSFEPADESALPEPILLLSADGESIFSALPSALTSSYTLTVLLSF